MDRRTRIETKLRESFAAPYVLVIDESHQHAGHAGAKGGGGHFRAVVVSEHFTGKSPVECQRLVYAALDQEMGSEIHALSMQTLTPAQWAAQAPGSAS